MKPIDNDSLHYDADDETNEQEETTSKARPSVLELLKKYWMVVAGCLILILFASLFLWLQSAKRAAFSINEPVAATSENIDYSLPKRSTSDIKSKSPSVVLEERRRAELEAQNARPLPTEQEVINAFIVDTAGQAARARQQRLILQKQQEKELLAVVDSVEMTVQESSTGVYRTQKVAVPARSSRKRNNTNISGSKTHQKAALPEYDTDGVPFEKDPKMLRMLSIISPEARDVYEKASGKRYRDPEALAQAQEQSLQASVRQPGADGFNTYRAVGTKYVPGKNSQQLTPDTFFKCVINGQQNVRTGSVIIMRLIEDAVVGGVTFPKNMTFAGIASVESNRVTVTIDRLGATRVEADIFDFNYMPGIMIDPEKKAARDINQSYNTMQQQSAQEIGMAIDRSASAANSVTGVAGRVAASAVGRIKPSRKLRQVLLPDGYPLLITTAAAGQM